MKIYSDYDEEPEEQFLPLPENLYREVYDLEMAGFDRDFQFYNSNLVSNSDVLELGCGSGRLSRLLADADHRLTGIDLSIPMLREALTASSRKCRFICMDMRRLAFHKRFDAIIIPYNTLNLLCDNSDVRCCLSGCRKHLVQKGILLLQLFIPSEELLSQAGKTTFQFQMLERPQGGKVIKEVLRKFSADLSQLEMTERYKVRPMLAGQPNVNYAHTMTLNANNQSTWLELLQSSGFTIQSLASTYDTTSPANSSLLLINAIKR